MSDLLEKFSKLCYQSMEMSCILNCLSLAAEQIENYTCRDDVISNVRDLGGALSLLGDVQFNIADKIWDVFYEYEKIESNENEQKLDSDHAL